MITRSINLNVAPWVGEILTQKALKQAIKDNKEFQTNSIMDGYGRVSTPKELKSYGYTHAQIRYGRRQEKVWYGAL